jgi:glycerol-3-phosphate dehydrogenase
VHAYGARAARVLGAATSAADLGRHFGATLTEAEVRYLIGQEWAVTAEDVLWRRSKLGLHLSADQAAALDGWMREGVASATAVAGVSSLSSSFTSR